MHTYACPAPAHRSISNAAFTSRAGNKSCHYRERLGLGGQSFQCLSPRSPRKKSPQVTRSCSPSLDPTRARHFLKPLRNSCFNQAAAGISISTRFVFSSERKHECETRTPLGDQTTALPDCLGLLVGWRVFSEAPSGSQVQLPE